MNIIGITGPAGAGKSTVADILCRHHGFIAVSLADHMKRIAREVFGFTEEQLWGPSEKRNEPDERWPLGGNGIGFLTPRLALQLLGTEWGRTCSENVWVEGAIRTATALLSPQSGREICYWPERGLSDDPIDFLTKSEPACLGVVIPDVRYDNEARVIRDTGGRIWLKHGDPTIRVTDEKWRSHSSEKGISLDLIDQILAWQPLESLQADVAARLRR